MCALRKGNLGMQERCERHGTPELEAPLKLIAQLESSYHGL